MAKKPKTNGAAAAVGNNSESLRQEIRDTFEDIYLVNQKIADATTKHVAPLRKQRVKFYRTLKANTGINRKTIDAEYAMFVIAKEAMNLEDDDHRIKVLDDLAEIHAALHPEAKQLDWIDAIERTTTGKKKPAKKKPARKKADAGRPTGLPDKPPVPPMD